MKNFLRSYFKRQEDRPDQSVKVAISFADLQGRGNKDAVAYVSGGGYCGSGGCTTFVLVRSGASYEVVMDEPITIRPIKVLNTKTHGWRDISVVRKGEIDGDHFDYPEIIRSFNGRWYKDNPVQDHSVLSGGRVLIAPNDDGLPLYP